MDMLEAFKKGASDFNKGIKDPPGKNTPLSASYWDGYSEAEDNALDGEDFQSSCEYDE